VKVRLRHLLASDRLSVLLVEETVQDGNWIDAVERGYNRVQGYRSDESRVMVVDDYKGGGFQQPIGRHRVMLARYDDQGKRYLYEDPIHVEVVQE
jgi:hypothetical protein